ncbi:MAG: hypothetical protein M5T61_11295 [Acidimicrobiia bacterium]|nr:hypothetical protein [Acidimicrobiia bacterium]
MAIWGGSLGARRVNEAALGLYDLWRGRGDVAVRHICGPRDHAECARRLRALRSADDGLVYDLVAHEDHMEDVYARAAVAVCRAGAGTVAELTAVGVPAVLVPLPGAPSDHQTRNSSTLAEAGAAVLLPDAECDAKRLDGLLTSLLADAARLEAMGASSRSLGRIDAAERLADFVEENADAR